MKEVLIFFELKLISGLNVQLESLFENTINKYIGTLFYLNKNTSFVEIALAAFKIIFIGLFRKEVHSVTVEKSYHLYIHLILDSFYFQVVFLKVLFN